ncbi:MAG: hypothetical protein OXI34_05215 [Chloroflexota bacterium]|nr:hypothetical protein [Chloroflexota bacterium]MDE2947385.1 hypothetical protein [Chloroflexota bacterium]
MYTIATLEDLKRHLNLGANDDRDVDDLLRALQEASHLIESATGRRYCPRVETLYARLDPSDPRALLLPDDLLELRAISDDGGAIDLADIRMLPGNADAPASILQRKQGEAFRPGLGSAGSVSISGVWGWHDRWSAAWRESGDKVRYRSLTASTTIFNVDDISGADEDGARPRFHVGHMLRIDGEYLRVTAIDRRANRLTVLRGVGGTRATTHLRDAKIETYAPAPAIRDLTVRYAELLLKSVGPIELDSSPLLERMRRLTA